MTTTTVPATPLDRAYVQSKVIETNLEHLRLLLLNASPEFTDRLEPLAEAFRRYVRSLDQACSAADEPGRAAA